MRYSDLKGNKLVSTSTADTIGKVDGFLLDPATRHVVALAFRKTETGSIVPWNSFTAVGVDAVTVPGAEAIVEADDSLAGLADKRGAVLKKRVLTTAGVDLGKVKDIEFDAETGALVELLLGDQTVAGARLRGVGSYAVVVDAE